MFDKFQSRLILEGEVETLTAIRIGAPSFYIAYQFRSACRAGFTKPSLYPRL